jgi:hypothetical protein
MPFVLFPGRIKAPSFCLYMSNQKAVYLDAEFFIDQRKTSFEGKKKVYKFWHMCIHNKFGWCHF